MFLLYDQKVKTKTKIPSERKEFLRWNLKTYFIFKGLSLKHIKQIFLQGKCAALNFFFNCYLAVPRPTLGHSRGDSLTNPMLITVFSTISTRRSPGDL